MTEIIKKLPSGFYAMYRGEKIIEASLIEWNGTRYLDSAGNWREFPEKVVTCRDFENWYQDATGTVYIQYKDESYLYIYAPGSRLYAHLLDMQRLARRRVS